MRPIVLTLMAAALAAPLLAQSLAEVAARDRERRARTGSPSTPAYTDSDLRASPAPSPSPSPAAVSAAAPASGVKPKGWRAPTSPTPPPSAAASPAPGPSPASPERLQQEEAALEQQWRAVARKRRDDLAAAQTQVDTLQARIIALQNDLNPDPGDLLDPNRQQNREAAITRAKADSEAARAALAAAQQAVDDLERDVLRAGGVPGWVR